MSFLFKKRANSLASKVIELLKLLPNSFLDIVRTISSGSFSHLDTIKQSLLIFEVYASHFVKIEGGDIFFVLNHNILVKDGIRIKSDVLSQNRGITVVKRIKIVFLFLLLVTVQLAGASPTDNNSELIPPLDILWEHELDSNINAITASNDSFYVAADKIYCFEPYTGKTIWQQNISSQSIYYDDNSVYVIDEDKMQLDVLDAADGSLECYHLINGSEGTLASDNDRLYLWTKHEFYVFNKATSKLIYEYYDESSTVKELILSDNELILLTCQNKTQIVQSFYFQNFTLKSEFTTNIYNIFDSNYFSGKRTNLFLTNVYASDNQYFYIGSFGGIESRYLDNLTENWKFSVSNPKQIIAIKRVCT